MPAELEMTFDPKTIEHLGVRMYSTLPPVMAELVGNSYDADASRVEIVLKDTGARKEIIVRDDGTGMSFDEINDKFLRIGRDRRVEDGDAVSAKGRKAIGKKGLGKLAFFGVAHEIAVSTKKDGKRNTFVLSWEAIKKSSSPNYKPTVVEIDALCRADEHGTDIVLREIQRESDFSPESLANSLSKMFIIDSDFAITIRHNEGDAIEVDNELKYAGLDIEVEWEIPLTGGFESTYPKRALVSGRLFTASKPIPPKSNMRGVTLFSRKKLVNQPEYFSDSTSSHFFSYLTGSLYVDFIDELSDDVIATNRQSLNWGHPEMKELREYLRTLLNWLEKDWRTKREAVRRARLSEASSINVPDWFSKLPEEIRATVEPVLRTLVKDSELPIETTGTTVRKIHEIIPEYPYFHWRHLHPEVRTAAEKAYQNGDYYTAFFEAVKKYVNAVKAKAGSQLTDRKMLEDVFSENNPKVSVTENFKKPSGADFEAKTKKNITEGHRKLVLGAWEACRCPIAHEEVIDLRDSGLFIEKDCLDALSLLSHLFDRLDRATKIA